MPLLIARRDSASLPRRASLKPLWSQLSRDILSPPHKPLTKVSVQVLDAREVDWLPAEIEFVAGKMALSHNHSVFSRIELSGAQVIGHIAKKHIQVIDSSQTFLFRLKTQSEYIEAITTMLLWSMARPAGFDNKLYTPIVPEPSIRDEVILVCNVDFSTASQEWRRSIAILRSSGVLDIGESGKPPLQSVSIRLLRSHQVRCLDHTIAGPLVLAVDDVYLRFSSDADLDDWFVSLKAFTQQTVYAPKPPDSLKSIRIFRSARIQSVSIRIARNHPALSPQTPGAIDADDLDFSNTYLEFSSANTLYGRTYVHTIPDVPYWTQSFQFDNMPDQPLVVNLKYTESGQIGPQDISIGQAQVEDTEWLELDNPQVPVSMHVQYRTESYKVLDSSYYEELKKQTLELSAGLAYKLGNTISQDMTLLCNTFFQIYLAERKQTEWVEFLIASEIEDTSHRENSLATMFRGNSMMTRGIEKYLQTIGRPVLERTVGRFVRKVLITNDTFELDPSRIASQLAAQGLANDEAEVEKAVAANRVTITNYMVFIWTLIRKEGVPEHFKWIFTFLSETMRTKLDVASSETIYSAVSAFLFLRFYCPALLNPQLFNLVDSDVTPANHRALTLVAKILQGFANRVRFGSKEPWLVPMNPFLEKYEGDLIDWYETLINFGGERPRERDAKEPPLAVYMDNQPSNPHLIDEWVCFARLARWGANVPFDKGWDSVMAKFFLSCKKIANQLKDIEEELDAPDKLDALDASALALHVNWDLCLFSNSVKILETTKTQVTPEKKRVWSKLMGW